MSEQQRPITPPPELVQQWASLSPLQYSDETWAYELFIAHQASRWAAGQQLEQDAEWLDANAVFSPNLTISPSGDALRQAMRPKSPSLKERALSALKAINLREDDPLLYQEILNAVEGLPYD